MGSLIERSEDVPAFIQGRPLLFPCRVCGFKDQAYPGLLQKVKKSGPCSFTPSQYPGVRAVRAQAADDPVSAADSDDQLEEVSPDMLQGQDFVGRPWGISLRHGGQKFCYAKEAFGRKRWFGLQAVAYGIKLGAAGLQRLGEEQEAVCEFGCPVGRILKEEL